MCGAGISHWGGVTLGTLVRCWVTMQILLWHWEHWYGTGDTGVALGTVLWHWGDTTLGTLVWHWGHW